MNYSAGLSNINPENIPIELIKDLNFYEFEIELCELQLESLAKNRKYDREVSNQLDRFQNQFINQQKSINKIREKVAQLCLLTSDFRLYNDWKHYKFNNNLKREIATEIQTLRQTHLATEKEYYGFLAQWSN